MRTSLARTIGALTASAVVGGLALVAAQPAAAADSLDTLTPSAWASVDSRSPHETQGGGEGNVRVGAWRDEDDKLHISKGYFSFDLSELAGRKITRATIVATDATAYVCDRPEATELWTVDSVDDPTWANQPAENAKLSDPRVNCSPRTVVWTVTDEVEQALGGDGDALHVAMRISEEHQGDVAYDREYYSDLRLNVLTNSPPDVPSELGPCGTDTEPYWTGSQQPRLSAVSDDRDRDWISGEFEVWPIDDPDQVTAGQTSARPGPTRLAWTVPDGVVEHGRTYEWRVRAADENLTSAWSDECQFKADFVSPAPPTVSSTDYPDDGQRHIGVGIPGEFTFDANGVEDVVGFYYRDRSYVTKYVAADELGGSATVTYTPRTDGPNYLYVKSVDRAGRQSAGVRHDFLVTDTSPIVTGPDSGYVGHELEYTLSTRLPEVASYSYQLNGGPVSTVYPGPDGTAAISVVLTQGGAFEELRVWSTTGDGIRTGTAVRSIFVADFPLITSPDFSEDEPGQVGVEGTFTLESLRDDLAGFTYCFEGPGENECGELTPDENGRATVTFTPAVAGSFRLVAYAVDVDGNEGWEPGVYYFNVTE